MLYIIGYNITLTCHVTVSILDKSDDCPPLCDFSLNSWGPTSAPAQSSFVENMTYYTVHLLLHDKGETKQIKHLLGLRV